MRILVAAGNFQNWIIENLKSVDIVNKERIFLEDAVTYINKTQVEFDLILVTDDAITQNEYACKGTFASLYTSLLENDYVKPIIFVTNNLLYKQISINENINIEYVDFVRIPCNSYAEICKNSILADKKNITKSSEVPQQESSKPKASFWSKFKSKNYDSTDIKATDERERKFSNISRGLHKVVAITGHRGIGVTSTAVNLAAVAAKRGLSAMLVDLDTDYRSTNLYFSGLNEESETNDDLKSSLVRTLASPQDYEITTFHVRNNLRLTSLPYSFSDNKLLRQNYTNSRLIGMLSAFRHQFNLCLVDLPFESLRVFDEILIHIDTVGLCVSNSTYSIINTLRNAESILDNTGRGYVNAKSKVIVTKYNDRAVCNNSLLSPQRVCELLTFEISDCFKMDFDLAGHISYDNEFDAQIGTEIPIVLTNSSFERLYENVLLRILE